MNRRTYVTEVNIDRKRRDKETEKYYGRAYKDKIETIQAIDRYGIRYREGAKRQKEELREGERELKRNTAWDINRRKDRQKRGMEEKKELQEGRKEEEHKKLLKHNGN